MLTWLRSPLLWLWYRLGTVALICPLAWEILYAEGAALKRKKKILFKIILYRELLLWCHGVKNLSPVAQVAAEAWVRSLAHAVG